MDKSEPSLVPEWLRSSGVGTGGGGLSHHFASSQADSPSALQKRNRSSNSTSNSSANHSLLNRSSSTNSRKTSSSNGSIKNDTNPYVRSYSNTTRNQRNRGRERLGSSDTLDPEYSDSFTSLITGRIEKDSLRRSQSMISRKTDELLQRRVYTDLRNNSINANGHGTNAVASGSTGGQKVSFERDFPVLRTDERPTTPDIVRVPSPGLTLSRNIQGLSIGGSPLIGSEGWTSALVEVPAVVGGNCITSPPTVQQPPYASSTSTALPVSGSTISASNGLNMAEALVQTPRSHNASQLSVQAQRSEELPSLGSKRLIPMTPSPKSLVLNQSDKLKPKTAMKPNEAASGPKNGLQQLSSLQVSSHPVRSSSARVDGPKSSSTGKQLLVLKPTRENVLSPVLKDSPTQTVPGLIANGQSIGASAQLKNPTNTKLSTSERKTSAYHSNVVPVVDKRLSLAQLRSRNDFFNLVRKKSMSSTSATENSVSVSSGFQKTESDELKKVVSGEGTVVGNGGELKCNGEACHTGVISSDHKESDFDDTEGIHPSEEEEAFLRSLGWEDNTVDEGGLTEEEINAFVQKYMKHKPASKLGQTMQLRVATESDPQASCSDGPSERTTDSSI